MKETSWNAAEGSGSNGHRFCTVNVGLTCCDDDKPANAAAELDIWRSAP